VHALCWCAGQGVCEERVDLKQIDVEMAAYNARRPFRDHDKLRALMLEYSACASTRPDVFEGESRALGRGATSSCATASRWPAART
jgi:hypothetical protein